MKDYTFGNKLTELRTKAGLSQSQLANLLDVTNKAVSKWENGDSKPTLGKMNKISQIFSVPLETFFEKNTEQKQRVHKIVLTGGPCSGKSTALSKLQTEYTKKGYIVLIVAESATEVILSGLNPQVLNNIDFQYSIMKTQRNKEQLIDRAIREITSNSDKNILAIYDRGLMDNKAYMTQLEFANCLKDIGVTESDAMNNYDAVFHLVTAAKGAEEFYTLENNKARRETTIDEAIQKDNETLSAWIGHPHLRVIDNSTNFNEKINKLIAEINHVLGDPETYEIERKFLITYPDIEKLQKQYNCQPIEIIQTYLKSKPNEEVRIRQSGTKGCWTYTKTSKRKISNMKRIETETRISKEEYLDLLNDANPNKKQIHKTRYRFMYSNQYFEIDTYPQWTDKALMEIELRTETQDIKFPKFVSIIKEVTNDENYYNANLAKVIEL